MSRSISPHKGVSARAWHNASPPVSPAQGAQHNRSNYLAEPLNPHTVHGSSCILRGFVVPGCSSRDWPPETPPEPRPPAPHTLGSTAGQNEHPEHYLGQIHASVEHPVVRPTLLFSVIQLSPAHSPAFTSSKKRFWELLQGFYLETLAAPLSHEHLKAGI